MPRSSATVRCTKKLTRAQKLPGPCTTTRSKQYISAVHLLTCSLLWVRSLFDPLQVWDFGGKWPWMETFINLCPKSASRPRFTCRGQIWRKSAVATLPKSHLILLTKNPASGTLLSSPFRLNLTDRAQHFVNVVGPWPVHVYRLWSGSAAVCRTYSGKSPKKWIQYRLSAYNEVAYCFSNRWKLFINFFPKSAFHPRFTRLGSNLAKIGRCEVAEKSSRIAYEKTPVSGTLLSP